MNTGPHLQAAQRCHETWIVYAHRNVATFTEMLKCLSECIEHKDKQEAFSLLWMSELATHQVSGL